ncbi:MAG: decarboxylating NADP(+)-dependent phosphogluconate dehydrogenase, partial [Desulfobacterales bacterium]|nr:decarboxylating NADP(+)-dependent phosphogluconate dehydrogenase [Desulfobacterales bacterium]
METKSDIGLIGLAVMGENLALNMESKGFTVTVYNRTLDKVDRFIEGRGKGKRIIGAHTPRELVQSLSKPRKIMLMVKSGPAVDENIEQLAPLLEHGDIIIDGGNSYYPDTNRRTRHMETKGLLYIGAGVSGGEEGALMGPSIMPGGSPGAWERVKPIFKAIAARVKDGAPCCEWMGEGGAGHFVKMVHNGIEYGDMQLICESYQIMRVLLKMSGDEMRDVFRKWNQGDLASYLIEITGEILAYRDRTGAPIVEKILDAAGQKGTGKWTDISALDLGVPLTLIGASVYARYLSARKEERVIASGILDGPEPRFTGDKNAFIQELERALFASKIISYAQGFALMKAASEQFGWLLNYADIARVWRGGCIIRSAFLDNIASAFNKNPDLSNMLLDDFFKSKIKSVQNSWRKVVSTAMVNGVSIPAMSSAL